MMSCNTVFVALFATVLIAGAYANDQQKSPQQIAADAANDKLTKANNLKVAEDKKLASAKDVLKNAQKKLEDAKKDADDATLQKETDNANAALKLVIDDGAATQEQKDAATKVHTDAINAAKTKHTAAKNIIEANSQENKAATDAAKAVKDAQDAVNAAEQGVVDATDEVKKTKAALTKSKPSSKVSDPSGSHLVRNLGIAAGVTLVVVAGTGAAVYFFAPDMFEKGLTMIGISSNKQKTGADVDAEVPSIAGDDEIDADEEAANATQTGSAITSAPMMVTVVAGAAVAAMLF